MNNKETGPPTFVTLPIDTVNAARKLPTLEIVAYTGGFMNVPGWGPLCIDLAGLEAGQVAILADHDANRSGVVGHGTATVEADKLVVRGQISADGEAAREVVSAAKNGFPWQASVGLQVIQSQRLRAGDALELNGRRLTVPDGGAILVARGKLREVSITALGCDAETCVNIAAMKRQGENSMEPAVEIKEGMEKEADQREANRIANITTICGGRFEQIRAKAIDEGWDEIQTELEVLRASRPKAPAVYRPANAPNNTVLEAALLRHMGMSGLGEKALGPVAMEQAERMGSTSMIDLCRAALYADGQAIPGSRMELVKAALSTYSLPTALGNVANKVMLDAYKETPATWRSFCAVRSVGDFKPQTAVRPTFTGPLQRVAKGGELKHGSVEEWTVEYAIDTFGKLLSIDRRDIINDDLSLFSDTAASLGRAAMRKISDLVYEVLLANEGGFFSAGNNNYIEGADSILNVASLSNLITLLRTQRDGEGNDLDLKPSVLLVGPELETTARALLESEFIQAQVDGPTGNSLRRAVRLEVEPRLSNTAKFGSDASDTHWFLFASPGDAAQIVAFLNGKQTPTTEFFGLDQDVNRLAVSWRVYHDFGTAMCDPRAAVRSKGKA
jgi:hypothetical protein